MRKAFGALLLGSLVAAAPLAAQRPFRFGAQGSWGSDTDLGIGIRYENPITRLAPRADHWRFIASFDYFFPDGRLKYWELNTNAAYSFRIQGSSLSPYVGTGLGIGRASFDGIPNSGNTELGLNILWGVRFPSRGVTPFVEMRGRLFNHEQFVLTGGVLFF